MRGGEDVCVFVSVLCAQCGFFLFFNAHMHKTYNNLQSGSHTLLLNANLATK